jgi:hypothetical protein
LGFCDCHGFELTDHFTESEEGKFNLLTHRLGRQRRDDGVEHVQPSKPNNANHPSTPLP